MCHLEAKMPNDLSDYLEKTITNNSNYKTMNELESLHFGREVAKQFDIEYLCRELLG